MAHRPATLVARTAPMRHQWRMVSTVRPARAAASAAVMVVIGIPSLCLYEHHTRVYGVYTIVGGEKPARRSGGRAHQDQEDAAAYSAHRSEEHTSELQSRENLVCRLLLE